MNKHLDAGRDGTWRLQQTATLARVARELRDSGIPLLLGGDLNAVPECAVHDALRDAGFRDAWPECGSGSGATFPAAAPDRSIDYVYLTGAARCDHAEVPVDESSDHRPLLVRVRLR
jgi:endonuclease/exonuclease/phosphatase (EEP) superfamily protein YafD